MRFTVTCVDVMCFENCPFVKMSGLFFPDKTWQSCVKTSNKILEISSNYLPTKIVPSVQNRKERKTTKLTDKELWPCLKINWRNKFLVYSLQKKTSSRLPFFSFGLGDEGDIMVRLDTLLTFGWNLKTNLLLLLKAISIFFPFILEIYSEQVIEKLFSFIFPAAKNYFKLKFSVIYWSSLQKSYQGKFSYRKIFLRWVR